MRRPGTRDSTSASCPSSARSGSWSPWCAKGSKLRGYSFSTLERIGGTPSLLVGVATVDRTVKAEQALRLLLGDQYRRALLAFPDEDVLVGTRLASPRPTRPSPGWPTSCPARTTRPAARSGPGAGAWPSASGPRAASTTAPSSWPVTASPAGALDLGGPKVKEPDDGVAAAVQGRLTIKRGDRLVAFGWAMAEDLASGTLASGKAR